ncbi:MAG: hypothetical protein HUU57_00755 [Bdellovibrio sp.]|nr:hypothetical protein [Bdellovibrio sp.]
MRSIDGFEFENSAIVTSSLSSVPLRATCSSFITDVELSFDGGATWMAATNYDPNAKQGCAGGSFNVTISNTKAPTDAMTLTSGQILTVKFRAQPKMGNPIYREVTVKYSPSTPVKQEVLVGSGVQSGGGLVLRGRARSQQQHTALGGAFVMKGRVVQ